LEEEEYFSIVKLIYKHKQLNNYGVN